jgi:hypothetical protein
MQSKKKNGRHDDMGSEKEQTFTDTCIGCQKKIQKSCKKKEEEKEKNPPTKTSCFFIYH